MKEKPTSISVVVVEEEVKLKNEVMHRRRNHANSTVHINFYNLPEDVRVNLPVQLQDSMVCKVSEPFYMSSRGYEPRKYKINRQSNFIENKPKSFFRGEFQLKDLKLLAFGELEHNESNKNRSTPVSIEVTAMLNAEDFPLLKLLSPILTTHLECTPEALERLGRNKEGFQALLSHIMEIFVGRTFSVEFSGFEFRRSKQQPETPQQTLEESQNLSTSSASQIGSLLKDGEASRTFPPFSDNTEEVVSSKTAGPVKNDGPEPPPAQPTNGSLKRISEENFKGGVYKKTPNLVQTKLCLLSLPPLRNETLEVNRKDDCREISVKHASNEKRDKKSQGLKATKVSLISLPVPPDPSLSYAKSDQLPNKQAVRDYFREKSYLATQKVKQTQPILLTVPTPSNQLSTSADKSYEVSSADQGRQVINKQVCKEYFRFHPDFYKKRLHYPTAKEWSDFTAQNNLRNSAKDMTDSEDSDIPTLSEKKEISSPLLEELQQAVPAQPIVKGLNSAGRESYYLEGYIYRTYSPFSLTSCIYPEVNEKNEHNVPPSPPTLSKVSMAARREIAAFSELENRDKGQSKLNENHSNTKVNENSVLSYQYPKCSPTAQLRMLYKEQYYRWRSLSRSSHSTSLFERYDNRTYSPSYPQSETPRFSRDWRNPRRP
ncbi:hypothetical protein Aperf_G00000103594 [Anoplocephala perfoliata]